MDPTQDKPAVDNPKGRPSIFETLFVRYGAGSDFIRWLTAAKWWNLIAWSLIVLGAVAWIVFLRWNPVGE